MLKECTVSYLSCPNNTNVTPVTNEGERTSVSCKNKILHGCNNLIAGNLQNFSISDLYIVFWSTQVLEQLNDYYTATGVKKMLEEKDYHALEMVISILAAFINRSLEYTETPVLTPAHTLYSNILLDIIHMSSDQNCLRWFSIVLR